MIFIILISIIILYLAIIASLHYKYPELRWDWNKIDTGRISFPKSFCWGTATASHQVEGNCTNNNWFLWESSKDENNIPRIKNNQKSGIACDHWNRYKEDIGLIKKTGVTHYRF